DTDGAVLLARQGEQFGSDVLVEEVADLDVRPEVVAEEFLEGADSHAGLEGDGLTGLAVEVGEEAAAVDAEQVKGLGVVTAEEKRLQVGGESRAQGLDLFGRHGNTS